ncbi:formamidopyrimidine-DNA glycosylase [Rhizoctonia solani AG-1 IB]|uniref:Formamidopyrimidine-DNA glycosylase n=1 Tax=Thanatephorus cucumeris (strain AG1-IB / isolate 7/3/14) TaxID=1108050 RepID=A0A0B7F107_THACB|nr:formamidopyrimidine-DNA glycosylase [Rhizoctonia solani AG-1 IB]
MPELPEVERAAKLTRHVAVGRTIDKVETLEDTIVYTGGITHDEFAKEVTGRKVLDVGRYGKVFYIMLDGAGRMPVLHLGMTGMVQVKGEEPTWYRRRNKDLSADVWPPPRFLKFIMHFSATDTQPPTQLAFIDARRLARIRLARDPLKEHPISELGFDPILSMPDFDEFKPLVLKRTCPIKALLLDQSFSAGVGNWVADEILFQSRIHPEQRANTLSESQLQDMYKQTKSVCEIAVAVNADSSQFPKDWLFMYRWGKGEKNKTDMILPSGEKAKLKWLTVGGRTSALVEQLQKVPAGGRDKSKKAHAKEDDDGEDDKPSTSKVATTKARKRKATRNAKQADDPSLEDGNSSDLTPAEDELAHKSDKRARRTVVQTSEKVVRKGSRSKAKTASLPARVTRSRAAEVVGDES